VRSTLSVDPYRGALRAQAQRGANPHAARASIKSRSRPSQQRSTMPQRGYLCITTLLVLHATAAGSGVARREAQATSTERVAMACGPPLYEFLVPWIDGPIEPVSRQAHRHGDALDS
jgi:hypothetical protein